MKLSSLLWSCCLLLPVVVFAQDDDTSIEEQLSRLHPSDRGYERLILKAFFEATGGDSWLDSTGWNLDEVSVCNFKGVECEGEVDEDIDLETSLEGGIMRIELADNNLNGRIPDVFWKLPKLQILHVSNNANLDISFNEIGTATNLHTLKMHNTATSTLTGISNAAASLKILHVAGMELNSVIPEEIFVLVNLEELILAEMNLQGGIPDGIANLPKLRMLNFYQNEMNGPIPGALAGLTQMESFTLSRNQFTGMIPTFLNEFTKLYEFYVEDNQFTGNLVSLEKSPNLKQVYFSNNLLEGEIPATFLAALQSAPTPEEPIVVNLAGNKLTGEVPATLDSLQNVPLRFNLADNLFTSISLDLCDNAAWDEGNPSEFSCDAILCPRQTYNRKGARTPDEPCRSCTSAEYMGQTTCSDRDDVGILQLLYQETGGDQWFNNRGWKDASGDICTWHGITCWNKNDERDGRVRHIHLDKNNLVGTVPQNIYALSTLTTLSLQRNKVELPFSQISNSPHMHHINVGHTLTSNFDGIEQVNDFFKHLAADGLRIQGTIPKNLFQIKSLTTLSMASCELTGKIDSEIAQMESLEQLYLYGNNLRGTIPEELGNMGTLQIVSLAQNQLTGFLPNSLVNLRSLRALSLMDQTSKGGGISGRIPAFEVHGNLTNLMLGKNRFEGTLPANLLGGAFSLDQLITVDVSHNLLSGTVPGGLARFNKMQLNLGNNLFTEVDDRLCSRDDWQGGNVRQFGCDALLCPQFTTSPTGRRVYDSQECQECNDAAASIYLGQSVCGAQAFPPTEKQVLQLIYDVCGGSSWKESKNWYTDEPICSWFGVECDEASSIVSIVLGDNGVTGTMPSEIFELPNLNRLSLFKNDVDFTFDGIEKARNLNEIVLDSTKLSSLKGVGKGRALKILNVRRCNLGGALPEELSRLVNLETLILADNRFVGKLPAWLNQLPRLEGLMLARNQFTGPLLDFGGFEQMRFLDLGENKLKGTIPEDFLYNVNTDEKIFVDLGNNILTGTVPGSLARMEELTIHLKENQLTGIDPALCKLDGWNNGLVQAYGCNGIMCPAGTFNSLGRQQDEEPCQECPKKSEFMGSLDCSSAMRTGVVLLTTALVALVSVALC